MVKLSQLCVGELPLDCLGDVPKFQPDEFRRYALTEKKFVTKHFLRLRFCLLYPYEPRAGGA